jgi:hypothetical protein
MGTVHRIEKSFDSEAIHAMGEAFDSAWRDLEASDIFSSQFPADWARDQIAKRIIAMAQRGERDPAAPEAAAAEAAEETRPARISFAQAGTPRDGRRCPISAGGK